MEPSISEQELKSMKPRDFRLLVRRGGFKGSTKGVCHGYIKAGVVFVPKDYAFEFMLFCFRNPRPFSLIDVTEPGNPEPTKVAPGADLRTDLSGYEVYKNGELVDEPRNIKDYWRDDLVAFLSGSGSSLDPILVAANVNYRRVGNYVSSIQCAPAGRFGGPMSVSLRLFKGFHEAVRAIQISSRHLAVHGAPIHTGDPAAIGIKDITRPDYSVRDTRPMQSDEIGLFWASGSSDTYVARQSKIPFMITHRAGELFVSDRTVEELAIL